MVMIFSFIVGVVRTTIVVVMIPVIAMTRRVVSANGLCGERQGWCTIDLRMSGFLPAARH